MKISGVLLALFMVCTAYAGEAVWIDVRTHEEFQADHLAGVNYHIPHQQIAEQIEALKLDKNTEILLYCRSGRRADIALHTLQQLGYRNVRNIGSLEDARRYGQQLKPE